MPKTTPIHQEIPVDKAWQVGRRIYVRAAYASKLNDQLRDLGAHWDAEVRALWIGSGKKNQVIPLVQEQAARVQAVQAVKAAGHWVRIPYEAVAVREQAKRLGAEWDRDSKQWAMPDAAALAEIEQAVTTWQAARTAQRQAELQAARVEDTRLATQDATRRAEGIIARAGRTVTDVRGTASGRLHGGRMRRPEAERAKPQPGEVRRLRDGRRVLVLECAVQFADQDAIDDGMIGNLWDDPGWYYDYQYVVVEPTAEEAQQDAREAAERADATEIDAVMTAAARTPVREVSGLSTLTGPSITAAAAGGMTIHGGKITITADGVWWQHPGWYDDYRRTEGQIVDESLIARIRQVIAGGSRQRAQYRVQA